MESFRSKIRDSSKLAVAAMTASTGYSTSKSKAVLIAAVLAVSIVWGLFVLAAFVFFSRTANRSGERFRLSLLFSLISIFVPPFAVVPICLNVHP